MDFMISDLIQELIDLISRLFIAGSWFEKKCSYCVM